MVEEDDFWNRKTGISIVDEITHSPILTGSVAFVLVDVGLPNARGHTLTIDPPGSDTQILWLGCRSGDQSIFYNDGSDCRCGDCSTTTTWYPRLTVPAEEGNIG